MPADSTDRERALRRDALALTTQAAAIGVAGVVAGTAFGPAGGVIAAFVGPYATFAFKRLRELSVAVEDAGFDEDSVSARLSSDETLAQLTAKAAQGVVESDLAAKRKLLARAVIRALGDDADVDAEARLIRTVGDIDTVDVRVLALLADPPDRPPPADETKRRPEGVTFPDELFARWPGLGVVASSAISTLIAAGLVENAGIGTFGGLTFWKLTSFGDAVLEGLREGGLDDELRSRGGQG